MKVFILVCGVAFLLGTGNASAEETSGFLTRIHKDPNGKEAKYVLYIPPNYKPDQAVPLILFLHGAGETGTDGHRQVEVGLGRAMKHHPEWVPAIVIFPQSQKRTWAADSADAKRALAILDEVQKQYKVNPKRIYLTGLSMGGFGTWSLAISDPSRWAAIVPICGGGNPKRAGKIKDIPCWCFHGGADNVVQAKNSRVMIDALKEAGASPIYTEYPDVGHNSWDRAYGTPELYEWLFKQSLH